MRFIFALATAFALSTSASLADAGSITERYFKALQMEEVFEILQEEGIAGGVEMAEGDPEITSSPAWISRLEAVYSKDAMNQAFRDAMDEVAQVELAEDAVAFFETDLGQRIVRIELDARTALGDEAVEEAARETAKQMVREDPIRVTLYDKFINVNNLVDSNVAGALNANLAFYRGLATSPTYAEGMTEGFILSTVWAQEPEIRADMEDWTRNFSTLAYSALTDAELKEYIAISETPSGQKLNTILFTGFDKVFERQSYELGRATAEFRAGEDT
ncbi:DUF2059 domain-containing protein [Litoreibacter roseus]|uniref:DUF2059 domain-containing protein n=1 Tax=Litoreibacter roseus TaxID=2601869 RepID=A0A6N6JN48_9RHOB|nr:DUF2059 domain-containing protein [Litoreibacter roseus]GFE66929.1 hypothetical protein KIN_40030 [Litoreibacter roseus]